MRSPLAAVQSSRQPVTGRELDRLRDEADRAGFALIDLNDHATLSDEERAKAREIAERQRRRR